MTTELPKYPDGAIRIHPEHPFGREQDWHITLDNVEGEVYLEELPDIMAIEDIPSLIEILAKALELAG